MGLDPPAVKSNRMHYPSAWSNRNPCAKKDARVRPDVVFVDAMSWWHGFDRKKNTTVEHFKRDFAYRLTTLMRHDAPCCRTYIIGLDQRPPNSFFIPKQVHTDDVRAKQRESANKRRAKKREEMTEEERAAEVTELDVTNHDPNRELPTDWQAFISNRENRWRLLQIIAQMLLDPRFITMEVNKTLVVQGIPVRKGPPVSFDNKIVYGITLVEENITQQHLDDDPDLFSRCVWIKGHQEPLRPAVTLYLNYSDWDTRTWEADLLPVHFYRFMSGQNWLVYSNDRDMLLTLLIHSMDRRRPGSDEFVDHMYLWLPNRKKKKTPDDDWHGDFHVDMNELYTCIDNDDELGAEVYNRVLTYVFVILLTGCDHVRKDMFFGISTDVILRCLYENAFIYKHMVQLSNLLIPDASAIRIPLVDERACIDFISRVYLVKYGDMIEKQMKEDWEKNTRRVEREYKSAVKKWEKEMARVEKERAAYFKANRRVSMDMDEDSDSSDQEDAFQFPDHLQFPPEPVMEEVPPLPDAVTRADIRARANTYKDPRKTLPDRNTCRRDVRHATLALLYMINGGRNQSLFERGGLFDPLKLSEDGETTYWGYEPDPMRDGKYRMSDFVYEKQDLVTYRYPQNYLENLTQKRRKKLQRDRDAERAIHRDDPLNPVDYDRKKRISQDLVDRYGDLIRVE